MASLALIRFVPEMKTAVAITWDVAPAKRVMIRGHAVPRLTDERQVTTTLNTTTW